ncbi:MAG: InlB B-repeat-containing protein, partial [Clostridiales bacterium]
MKKPKKRLLWLAITAIMVLMFAMSASAMAANNELTVTYVNDGKVIDTTYVTLSQSGSPGTYYYSLQHTLKDVVTKEGYTFNNWKSSWGGTYNARANFNGISNTNQSFSSTQSFQNLRNSGYIYADDIVFTANYTPIEYDLTLRNPIMTNPPTVNIDTTTFANKDYDSNQRLPIPTVGNTFMDFQPGYIFMGWKDIATGITYTPNPTDISYPIKGDATLEAIWVKDVDYQKVVRFIDPDTGALYNYVQRPVDSTVPQLAPPTKPGYTFAGWSTTKGGNVVLAANANIPFGAADPAIYYAVFEANGITLSSFGTDVAIYSGDSGTTALSGTYPAGSTVAFYVAPNAGFDVESVRVETAAGIIPIKPSATAPNAYTFTMPTSATTIYAKGVSNTFGITKDQGMGTTIDITNPNGATKAKAGTTVEFTATATDNHFAVNMPVVKKDSNGDILAVRENNGTFSFVMPKGDVTISTVAEQVAFEITQGAATNLDIKIIDNPQTNRAIGNGTYVTVGTPITFTATPNKGFILKGAPTVTMGNTLVPITQGANPNTFQFTMPAGNVTIGAQVIQSDYNIGFQTDAALNFTITNPAQRAVAAAGSAVNFTLTAVSDKNIVEDVQIIGTSSGHAIPCQNVKGTWTFSMPEENVMISAKAVKNVFDVNTMPDVNTTIFFQNHATTITAAAGETVTFTAGVTSQDSDYELKEVKILGSDGKAVSFEKIEIAPQQAY